MNTSDETHTHSESNEPLPAKKPVGAQLKALREERGLSVVDFAHFSALPQDRIEAFERAEYSKIGIDTFVVGYIRKYAIWLKVDASTYIGDYHREPSTRKRVKSDHNGTVDKVLVSKSQVKLAQSYRRPKTKAFSAKVLALVVLILVCCIALVIVVFASGKLSLLNQTHEGASQTGDASTQSLFSRTADQVVPINIDPSANALDDFQEVIIADSLAMTPTTAPQSSVDDRSESDLSQDTALQLDATDVSIDITDDDGLQTNDLINPTSPSVQSLSIENNTAASESDTLVFSFSDDCWLEISSDDQILFAGLKRAGTTHVQQGQAPFTIMLGNVQAASLKLNGNPFDIKPIAGRNTLRFTVAAP